MRILPTMSVLVLLSSCGVPPSHTNLMQTPGGSSLSFAELNLDWFGVNGEIKNPMGSETRVPSIRKYLQENKLLSDVMVFEEILDLDLLQDGVLDGQYTCHTYQRPNPRHQHVVICHTLDYILDVADDAEDYALESVDVNGYLRPAVHGILKNKDGTRLVHIFGVHLKANADKSAVRLEQVKNLADYIKQEKGQDPVVVLGDFNTFNADEANMDKIFRKDAMNEVDFPEPYTWASTTEKFDPAKFDRVWLSKSWLTSVQGGDIKGPCSSGDAKLIENYNQQVSDHCATTFTVVL